MFETLKQWAFTLVITAVVGGLANALTISDSGGMKKYIRFACAAVALAVMIMPIRELLKEMPNLFDFNLNADAYAETEIYGNDAQYAERLNELTIAKTDELLKLRISDIVYEKTGIKPDGVYIYIGQKDYSKMDVEKIIIVVDGVLDVPPKEIENVKVYLQQLFNCDVEIGDKTND